jgi:cell division protein FtsZ
LIVSGSQEITIDEIGEINDHIQAEAGYGANIIMGVGEDDSLGEAISVTIIATGFDVTQQNEITNTEVKKVVHALEDEQTMEHDLIISESTNKLGDLQIAQEETIIHDLNDDTFQSHDATFEAMDLIPTTELIKNIDVVSQTVDLTVDENDFIINDVSTNLMEDNEFQSHQEDQTMLTFDLPISSKPSLSESDEVEVFTLEDNINQIEVNDYIELIPVNEANQSGEMHYALDDHIILEQTDKKFDGAKQETPIQVEDEIEFKKITIEEREVKSDPDEKQDPFNSPISKTLIERADERRQKMKAFNYKFNSSKIEEIEKEPAYKRQGISLSDIEHSSDSHTSRTTIGLDDNDEVQLRSNNSYLHDNVD